MRRAEKARTWPSRNRPCVSCGKVKRSRAERCKSCENGKRQAEAKLIPCPNCGVDFWPWANGVSHTRKTCGCLLYTCAPPSLLPRACAWCERVFAPTVGQRLHCSKACAHKHTVRRKRLRRKGLLGQPSLSLPVVYRLHQGVCALCGQLVAIDRARPKREWATIDHVIPLAKGGRHAYDNVQLAHLGCNSSKGARVISRDPRPFLLSAGAQARDGFSGLESAYTVSNK